jgi:hypothetical protein
MIVSIRLRRLGMTVAKTSTMRNSRRSKRLIISGRPNRPRRCSIVYKKVIINDDLLCQLRF